MLGKVPFARAGYIIYAYMWEWRFLMSAVSVELFRIHTYKCKKNVGKESRKPLNWGVFQNLLKFLWQISLLLWQDNLLSLDNVLWPDNVYHKITFRHSPISYIFIHFIHRHTFSYMFVHFYQFFIDLYPFWSISSSFKHFYPFIQHNTFSSIFIHFYPFHPFLSIFIHFYPFSTIVIQFYPFHPLS